jgi:hypothetical protein
MENFNAASHCPGQQRQRRRGRRMRLRVRGGDRQEAPAAAANTLRRMAIRKVCDFEALYCQPYTNLIEEQRSKFVPRGTKRDHPA